DSIGRRKLFFLDRYSPCRPALARQGVFILRAFVWLIVRPNRMNSAREEWLAMRRAICALRFPCLIRRCWKIPAARQLGTIAVLPGTPLAISPARWPTSIRP